MNELAKYGPILIAGMISFQCVEPYDAPSIDYEKIVVVDGLLTDEATAHVVRLSYTYPIDNNSLNPIKDAEVWITDGNDTRINLSHIGGGAYVTDSSYRGTPGESYQLHFITDEQEYRSEPETLIASSPIDSIYDRYVEMPNDEINRNEPGIQFFVDTQDDAGLAKWFRYEWSDTYQLVPEFPSLYDKSVVITEWDTILTNSGEIIIIEPDTLSYVFERTEADRVHPCYESRQSTKLIIGSTVGSRVNRLREMPVNFVSGLEPILRERYSIDVRQFAISEKAFNFYRKINESIESTGSLFDKQQGAILGNIHSVESPSNPVLGYFEVAGVSFRRAFFKFRDLDQRFPKPRNFYYCDTEQLHYYGRNPEEDTLALWVYFEPHLDMEDLNNTEYYVVDRQVIGDFVVTIIAPFRCTSCNWYASIEAPEFWPEEFIE